MKFHTALMSGALAVALLAPAAADAHKVSSSQSVRVHARAADRALAQFESSVEADAETKAARALARNRRQMRAASRETRRVRRSASGRAGAKRAAAATMTLGLQADTNSAVLADAANQVDGDLQADVAAALEADLLTGAGALEALTGLIDDVPASAQGAIAQAIGTLAQAQQVVADIVAALKPGDLTAQVQQALTASLGIAIATVDAGIEALNALVGVASGVALPLAQQALGIATGQLGGLTQTLQGLLATGLPALPGLPALGGGSGSVEIGVDGSQSVKVSGLCGLVPALPVALPGC